MLKYIPAEAQPGVAPAPTVGLVDAFELAAEKIEAARAAGGLCASRRSCRPTAATWWTRSSGSRSAPGPKVVPVAVPGAGAAQFSLR
jgi:hypothetical protein